MKALMITSDQVLHAEIGAQGAARMPALNLTALRASPRDALERALAEAPALVIVDAGALDEAEPGQFERLAQQHPDEW